MDVKKISLKKSLEKTVYIVLPKGFAVKANGQMIKNLKKPINGLEEAFKIIKHLFFHQVVKFYEFEQCPDEICKM